MVVGERILKIRQEKRMTQTEVARKAGLANATLCDIEKGRLTPSLRTLEKLAFALGVHITEFFTDRAGTTTIAVQPTGTEGHC
jgi:transcriptional regulator with XRE-family HTH domain